MPPADRGPLDWGPLDANISMLFTELPLLARPAAARAAGFTAVEAWWPFGSAVPADAEVTAFERAVREAGVQLVALNGFAGDMAAGERGILSWPGRQPEFLDNLDVLLGLGARLDCRRFNLLYGNRLPDARTGRGAAVRPRRMSWRCRIWPPPPGPRGGRARSCWWSRSARCRGIRCAPRLTC